MILYINGNYPHHSLHSELVTKLAELGNEITVFVPIKGRELEGKYPCNHPNVTIVYDDCLKVSDKAFFLSKIHRIVKEIEKRIDIKKVSSILAGTLYSDGFAAYLLHHKYGIPFSVAVRETDVTYHMKWRPYLNGFVKQLLDETTKIIFLSPAYKKYIDRFGNNQTKYEVIPNAVNEYWFSQQKESRKIHNPVSLIYVGEISKRKNVETTISVVAELNKRNVYTEFHIVGSGEEENKCHALVNKLGIEKQVFFHGWQNGKDKIKVFYDEADIFIMLSHKETFGTVYVEALSQGLPIIYTKGQGIYGYFDEGSVGYGCSPTNMADIVNSILKIIDNYDNISKQCVEKSRSFKWDIVAKHYDDMIHSMRKQ